MASTPKAEYVGFTVNKTSRVYTLRVSQADGGSRQYAVSIAKRAFLENRIGYQDGPVICFLKLESELRANGDDKTASKMHITDAELVEYRDSHQKKPSNLRPWPAVKR
jgi:hypothetical protein